MVKKYKRILVIFLIIVMLMPFGTHIFADTQDIQQNQYAYTGFSGIYQQICVNGKVVYQEDNNFWLSDDDTLTTEQQKAQFLPRDMGDGSYAFENRLTENRIATAEDNKELLATIYNFRGYFNKRAEDYEGLNDDTQHWILEKTDKENEYYLKSLENNLYMGVSDENKLIAVSNENKAVFTFNPLYNESPLYQLSINSGYARLTELQRERLERVYESVAGDVFDRTGQYFENKDVPKETPRAKIDNIYKEVSENNNDSNTCFTKLNSYLKPNNAFVSLQLLNHLHISKELPGTENVRSEIVSNGQELPDKSIGDGKRYQCSINIYDKNNNLEQTISMTIIDSGLSVITNARMFAKILTYIPYVLRKNITTASCYKSFSSSGKFLTDLHSIEIALVAGSTEEGMLDSVVHELGHSIDRGYGNSYHFSSHGEWSVAREQDIFAVSDYANSNDHECFSEFCRIYFSAYTNKDWARAIEILFPNQYALFKRVRMDYLDGYTLWDDGPEKEVTVTLNYNNDGKTEPKKIVVDQYSLYSENIKKLSEEPVWEGHKFLGWFTEAEGGKLIDDKQRVINENEHTLYAHWEDTNIYPKTVTLNKTEITLTKGDIENLIAIINPDNAIDKTLTWKSSDTSVAKVDENGKITSVAKGNATITVTTSNGKTATCKVTVKDKNSNTNTSNNSNTSTNNNKNTNTNSTNKNTTSSTTIKTPNVSYRTHVENIGWQNYVKNGETAGTSGKGLRLEGINIKLENNSLSGNIEYCTHVQNIGWQNYVKNGAMSGTSGKGLRLEAIKIRLTGDLSKQYDIYYRVHCQNFGWMGWAKNGSESGSARYGYRLEAIQIKLVKKNGNAPGSTANSYKQNLITYQTHVQNLGWQGLVNVGEMSGTSGQSLRLEGIKINLNNLGISGNIEYCTHVQNIGWQNYVKNGAMSGTSGKGLRLEAIKIRLTGDLAKKYDVYYRVHCQNFGWMGWAKNGASSGSAGYGYRLEGIEIVLVEKGGKAPGSTENSFIQK